MNKLWFTADHHFGHTNIIQYCKRPFSTVGEMDCEMIRRWNEVVGHDDEVWHLGDFSVHGGVETSRCLLNRLNGVKHLVLGNHDGTVTRQLLVGWASVHKSTFDLAYGGGYLTLVHNPTEVRSGEPRVVLHGHAHNQWVMQSRVGWRYINVGVDVRDFYPVSLDTIVKECDERMG